MPSRRIRITIATLLVASLTFVILDLRGGDGPLPAPEPLHAAFEFGNSGAKAAGGGAAAAAAGIASSSSSLRG